MRRFASVLVFVLSAGFFACSNSDTSPNTPGDGGNSSDHATSGSEGSTPDGKSGGDTGGLSADASPQADASTPSDGAGPGADATNGADAQGGRDASTEAASSCTGTQILCGATCVEPATDQAHCGGCNMACANNQACISGVCVRIACEAGTTACAGACVDTQTDSAHCGGCNMSCGAGATCMAGHCACGAASQVDCSPLGCFDLMTDPSHCGGCNNSCGPGGMCSGGMCTCAMGVASCGSACANLANDPNNCGRCGRRCSMGTVACMAGQCQNGPCDGGLCCAPGYTDCSTGAGRRSGGPGTGCVDLLTDPANCGTCGTTCMNSAMMMCVAGMCI